MSVATILIPARNAARTIQRAVQSARAQGAHRILLIDDFSEDATVALAREAGGDLLHVVRPLRHSSLGLTRQTGLDAIETPYGVWLDADDELLPGRVDRFTRCLAEEGADIVADALELVDGESGEKKGAWTIPAFLARDQAPVRLFERNYLPGIGVIGFRAEFARRVAYDPEFHGAEDVDFILRAIALHGRFRLLNDLGYRSFHYKDSLSRQIDNQRRMVRRSLLKHSYVDVRTLYTDHGYSRAITGWGLVSMALFREEYDSAMEFLDEVESRWNRVDQVLEPEGPYPVSEEWRISFCRGTVLLWMGFTAEAAKLLKMAESIRPSAEGANNLGVAFARLGKRSSARELFGRSLRIFPQFRDARRNLREEPSECITTHPLRMHPYRNEYQLSEECLLTCR